MMLQRWVPGWCISGVEEVATGGDRKKKKIEKYQIFFFGLGCFLKRGGGGAGSSSG